MERRSEARTEIGPWLEHLAWNAAALAALAVMLLVLLGSLEWLDAVAAPRTTAWATAKVRNVHLDRWDPAERGCAEVRVSAGLREPIRQVDPAVFGLP